MQVSITTNTTALSDLDLQQLSQLGVDKIDFGNGNSFHGVSEQGFPDLDELLKLKKRIRSWGMDINRVTLRSEEHTSELQSRFDLVCRLLLAKKNAVSKGLIWKTMRNIIT